MKRAVKNLKDMTVREVQMRLKSRAQNFLNEIEFLEYEYRQDMLELHRALFEAENREKQ